MKTISLWLQALPLTSRVTLFLFLTLSVIGTACATFTVRNMVLYNGLTGCAASDDASCIDTWLRLGADINSADPETKSTALMAAANAGNFAAVERLIQRGADVNAKDYYNHMSALAMTRDPEIKRFLIEHGAK